MLKKYLSTLLLIVSCVFIVRAQHKSTYVIVHGAWGGTWQFKNTSKLLQDAGHTVYRASLTGLGDRYHLACKSIDLTTHVKDVVNLILFEDLRDVILVGHSYGGMVITAVADSLSEHIKRMVYLDAIVPSDGESVFDALRGGAADSRDEREVDRVDFLVPVWVKDTTVFPRDVPHPIGTFKERVSLKNADRLKIPTSYILTYEPDKGGMLKDDFYKFYQKAEGYHWNLVTLEASHNPQIDKLDDLVKILLKESEK